MFYCKPVYLDRLQEIQKGVSKAIAREILNVPRLFYPIDNKKVFLEIESLRSSLEELNLIEHLNSSGIALHILMPNSSSAIHIDTGTFPYSLNIPITHCKDSVLYFYELKNQLDNIEKYKIITPYGTHYYKFEEQDCNIVNGYEMSTPFIMNTKLIHSVTNSSDDPRITLLIRLNSSAEFVI